MEKGNLVFEISEIKKKFDYTSQDGNLLVKGDATLEDPSRKIKFIHGRCYHKDDNGDFTVLFGNFTVNGTVEPATSSISEMSFSDHYETYTAMLDIKAQIEGSNTEEE